MDARAEALERTVLRKARELGISSEAARHELALSVRANPDAYVSAAPERALLLLAQALESIGESRDRDDYLDDDQYRLAFMGRMGVLAAASEKALEIDPESLDAKLLLAIATPQPVDRRVRSMAEALAEAEATTEKPGSDEALARELGLPEGYSNLFCRPRLRVLAAISRWSLLAGQPRRAVKNALKLLAATKREHDPYGARFTLALAYARLEDEAGFQELDRAWGHRDSAWSALARMLLLFKLDRMPAARRALSGYVSVYESGAFGLANPTLVEPYLPDRPRFEPGSLDEVVLAVHEAEPIIQDTPDFMNWCNGQPGFLESADAYARRMGYDS